MISIKKLFKRLEKYTQDYSDGIVVKETDFSKGKSFEDVAKRLGINSSEAG